MDRDELERMYVDEGMSYREIAEELGTSKMVPEYWIDKYDIESRKSKRERPPNLYTDKNGHTIIRSHFDGETERIMLNRLLATLLVDDLSELDGMDVHHKLDGPGVKPDYVENLKVVTRSEHKLIHANDHVG